MTKISVDKLWKPVHKSQRSVPPTIRRRAPSYPAVIARSEATWQSPGSTVQPKSPVRRCPEIATAPLGPRNDRCGRWSAPGLRFPLSLRGAKRRGNPYPCWQSSSARVLVTAQRSRSACTWYGLPRPLRGLAMTSPVVPLMAPTARFPVLFDSCYRILWKGVV